MYISGIERPSNLLVDHAVKTSKCNKLNSEGRPCRKERDHVRKARILQEEYPLVIDMKCMERIPEAARTRRCDSHAQL
jgi:hypothetical protein